MKSTLTKTLAIIAFLVSSLSTVSIAQTNPQKLSIRGILKLIVTQTGNQMTINSVPDPKDDDANGFQLKEKNGTLVLESDIIDGLKSYTFNMNNLSEIHVDGITHVSFRNILQFGYMKFKIDGIIDGPININATQVDIDTKGISELFIEGRTQHVNIKADGISTVCAKNLVAQTGMVESDGINDVWVNVMQHLQVKVDGIGNVYFKNYNWSDALEQRQPRLYSQISGISHVKMWKDNGKNECNDKGSLMNTEIKKVEDPKKAPETPKSKGVIKTGNGNVDIQTPGADVNVGGNNGNVDIKVGSDVDVKVGNKDTEDLPEPKPVQLPKQDPPKSKGKIITVDKTGTTVNTGNTKVDVGTGGTDVQTPGTGVNVNQGGVDVNTTGTNVNVGTNGTSVETKSSSKRKSKGKIRRTKN